MELLIDISTKHDSSNVESLSST